MTLAGACIKHGITHIPPPGIFPGGTCVSGQSPDTLFLGSKNLWFFDLFFKKPLVF